MNNIGEVISHCRREKRLSQIDIADMLKAYGIHIKNGAVSSWEKGKSIPGETSGRNMAPEGRACSLRPAALLVLLR